MVLQDHHQVRIHCDPFVEANASMIELDKLSVNQENVNEELKYLVIHAKKIQGISLILSCLYF